MFSGHFCVGYNTATVDAGDTYAAVGPSFIDVGADGTFTLNKAFKPTGAYNWDNDKLYLVNPTSCAFDKVLIYEDGWYDEAHEYEECGDIPMALGTGLQTQLSSNGLTVQSSGQVFGDSYTVGSNGAVYQFIVNGTGRTVNWSEIVPGGDYNWDNDKIYIINPDTCAFDKVLIYEDGWYDEAHDYVEYTEDLEAGKGFQTQFTAGNDITITFPPAIDAE